MERGGVPPRPLPHYCRSVVKSYVFYADVLGYSVCQLSVTHPPPSCQLPVWQPRIDTSAATLRRSQVRAPPSHERQVPPGYELPSGIVPPATTVERCPSYLATTLLVTGDTIQAPSLCQTRSLTSYAHSGYRMHSGEGELRYNEETALMISHTGRDVSAGARVWRVSSSLTPSNSITHPDTCAQVLEHPGAHLTICQPLSPTPSTTRCLPT